MKFKFLEPLILSHKKDIDNNIVDAYHKLGGNGTFVHVEGFYDKSSYGCSHAEGERISSETRQKVDHQKSELKPKLCVCCGAPIHGFKCEYCGVEYE